MAKPFREITIPHEVKKVWTSLPHRQRQFILNYFANGCNATRAYASSGYHTTTENSLGSASTRLLTSVKIRPIVYAILKAHRLTPEYADLKHSESLEATETKFFAHEGHVVEEREVIAWGPRLQSLDMLHKIHRRYGKNGNGNGGDTHVHVTVRVEAPKEELAGSILSHLSRRTALAADHA